MVTIVVADGAEVEEEEDGAAEGGCRVAAEVEDFVRCEITDETDEMSLEGDGIFEGLGGSPAGEVESSWLVLLSLKNEGRT